MFIPEGFGVARIVFSGPGKSTDKVTTFGYDIGTSLNPAASASDIDTILRSSDGPCRTANMIVGCSYQGVSVTENRGLGPVSGFDGTSVSGTGTGSLAPPNVALLVRKFTTRGGRQGRGRMFLPPYFANEGDINSDGTVSDALANVQSSIWMTTLAALEEAEHDMVLLHADPELPPDPVISLVFQTLAATQRRRLR